MPRSFPRLFVSLPKLRENTRQIVSRCNAQNIAVCGVVKGCSALPPVARAMLEGGVTSLASSRLEQLAGLRQAGITAPFLLLRICAPSEIEEMVALCDVSLQSEWDTLCLLEQVCRRRGCTHQVIIMADLGDLREGFWDQDELVNVCVQVERQLPHVHLLGIGVNLGCVGSVQPTPEKMESLLTLARRVESAIARKLEVISGGATSSYTLVHWNTMPQGINHLRIGENILLGKDLQLEWHIEDMDYLSMDTFTLTAEVIEVKTKPSYPQGQLCFDAFGNKPSYVDYGTQRRVLLALGRADAGPVESLLPRDKGLRIWGASSDHCVLDATHCERTFHVGDTVDFSLSYSNLLYLSARDDVCIVYEDE